MGSTAEERLIIVPYQPGYGIKRRLFVWLAILIGIAGGVAIGWYLGSDHGRQLSKENSQLSQQLAVAQQQAVQLQQQIATLQRGRAIDDAANKEVQQTIQDLEEEIQQLSKDVAFYKTIMAPSSKDDKGLKIQKLELAASKEPRKFQYKLVLTQVADNSSYISGLVAVNLIGSRGEAAEVLALRDVAGADDLGMKFRFRYFQDIEGELVLPEDFTASQVQVVAQATGKKATKIERIFDWKVEG